jgi:hypothetical protein
MSSQIVFKNLSEPDQGIAVALLIFGVRIFSSINSSIDSISGSGMIQPRV